MGKLAKQAPLYYIGPPHSAEPRSFSSTRFKACCSLTSIHPALRYKQWGLTTILRGFRVPVAALDRFLQANGLMPTFGDPPSSLDSQTDPASMLLRTKLGDDHGDSKTRLFIPFKKGRKRSDVAYIAYDWVMVFAQRQVNLGEELLDRPPPRFAELRDDMLQFADREGQQKVEDLSALFVVITDEECFPFVEPYLRKSDLCCDQCEATFPDWFQRQQHRQDAHGSTEGTNVLPRDF